MSYKDKLFTRYGSPCRDAEIRIQGYLTRPENCDTFDAVAGCDRRADELIAQCKSLIEQLTEYRQDLAARYAQLATMPSKDSVKLERYKKYDNSVIYYIHFYTEYEDGTKVETGTESYAGKERHAALKRFEALKKARPGIEYVMDIEKKSWER